MRSKSHSVIDITGGDKDFQLWLLFSNTRHLMLQAVTKELSKYYISPGQAHVLRIIHELGDEATLQEISAQTYRAVHTISNRVTSIEKKGLVRKKRTVPGSTLLTFELTDKGLGILRLSEKRENVRKIINVLSPKEKKLLNAMLTKMFSESKRICDLP